MARKTEWDRVAKWKRDEIKWQRELTEWMPTHASASQLAKISQANAEMVNKLIPEMERITSQLRAAKNARGDDVGLLNESFIVGAAATSLLTADVNQHAKTALDTYNSRRAVDVFVDHIGSHFPVNKK